MKYWQEPFLKFKNQLNQEPSGARHPSLSVPIPAFLSTTYTELHICLDT